MFSRCSCICIVLFNIVEDNIFFGLFLVLCTRVLFWNFHSSQKLIMVYVNIKSVYMSDIKVWKNLLCDQKEQNRNIFNMQIKKKISKNNYCSIINDLKENNNWVQFIPPCVTRTEDVYDMRCYMRYKTIRSKNILWKIIVTIMPLGQSVRETV